MYDGREMNDRKAASFSDLQEPTWKLHLYGNDTSTPININYEDFYHLLKHVFLFRAEMIDSPMN